MILGTLIAASTLCFFGGLAEPAVTAQMFNGRAWRTMDKSTKLFYVSGIRDQIALTVLIGVTSPNAETLPWASGFNTGDYIDELDALYKNTENVRIPIPFAVHYCTSKLKGGLTKEKLEAALITLRKLVSTLE
jgi:hypothetical protein